MISCAIFGEHGFSIVLVGERLVFFTVLFFLG